ncbi:MAG: sugar transferase [Clostridia bacterium]|nr:sugar transferase [Clostridia bacterium]
MDNERNIDAEVIKGKGFYLGFKRVCGFISGILGTIVLSPLLLFLCIWILIDDGGPVLFKQKRVGKNKKHFMIYKFRTMKKSTPHDTPTHLLKDPEQYITRSGKFMRKTSLDELPQLFNIIKGDIDVVGPRPALWNQYDLIEERDKFGANAIRPGLTGWAQANGRDTLSIEKKAELDGYYVKNMGVGLDIKSIFLTVKNIGGEGVVEGGPDNAKKDGEETKS